MDNKEVIVCNSSPIMLAAKNGLIDDFEQKLTQLKEAGFWIKEEFLEEIVRTVKER